MMERKNINRGYKKLDVWRDAIDLYVLAVRRLSGFNFVHQKTAANVIDSAHSISRNIAEGYCRKSIREYMNFLNIALGSAGEFHSSICSFLESGQITEEQYELFDSIHYRLENRLINLIKSLNRKVKTNNWSAEL